MYQWLQLFWYIEYLTGTLNIWQLPVDSFFTVLLQPFVGTREMAVSQKAAMCRQGRWVYRFKHQVFVTINVLAFLLRIRAPKHEHQILPVRVQGTDYLV